MKPRICIISLIALLSVNSALAGSTSSLSYRTAITYNFFVGANTSGDRALLLDLSPLDTIPNERFNPDVPIYYVSIDPSQTDPFELIKTYMIPLEEAVSIHFSDDSTIAHSLWHDPMYEWRNMRGVRFIDIHSEKQSDNFFDKDIIIQIGPSYQPNNYVYRRPGTNHINITSGYNIIEAEIGGDGKIHVRENCISDQIWPVEPLITSENYSFTFHVRDAPGNKYKSGLASFDISTCEVDTICIVWGLLNRLTYNVVSKETFAHLHYRDMNGVYWNSIVNIASNGQLHTVRKYLDAKRKIVEFAFFGEYLYTRSITPTSEDSLTIEKFR